MRARIVRIVDMDIRDRNAWSALARHTAEPNPLMEPECLIPAAQHLENGDAIHLALAEENDLVYACIPIRAVRDWHGFPYPFVTTQVRRTIECGTPLMDLQRGTEAMTAILEALAAKRGLFDSRVLVLPRLTEDGPVVHAIRAGANAIGLRVYANERWEQPMLHRRPEMNYRSDHGGKFLRNLARLRRNLSTNLGEDVRLVDRSDDPTAINAVIAFELTGYKAVTGVAMTTHSGEPDWVRDMCDQFRSAGRLHLYALQGGSTIIAVMLLLQAGDGLFLLKLGYDQAYARYRPGLQLQLDVIDYFHTNTDCSWLDTCTFRDNETLLWIYPDRKQITGLFVPLSKNPMDRMAIRSFMALRPMYRRILGIRAQRPPS